MSTSRSSLACVLSVRCFLASRDRMLAGLGLVFICVLLEVLCLYYCVLGRICWSCFPERLRHAVHCFCCRVTLLILRKVSSCFFLIVRIHLFCLVLLSFFILLASLYFPGSVTRHDVQLLHQEKNCTLSVIHIHPGRVKSLS